MLAIDVKALCDIPYDLPSIDQRVFRVLPSSNEVLLELEMKEAEGNQDVTGRDW